jgi:hypothetical protein
MKTTRPYFVGNFSDAFFLGLSGRFQFYSFGPASMSGDNWTLMVALTK